MVKQAILRNPALALAVIVSALSLSGLFFIGIIGSTFANDFGVYWRAANEPADIAYLPHGLWPFPYAPTMLLWVRPHLHHPLWPSFLAWTCFSLASFVAACRYHLSSRATLLAVGSPPVVTALLTGQVSVTLTAALLYACTTRHRIIAGLFLGAAASIKPQLVLLAPLILLLQRDWRAVATMESTLVGLALISLSAFGVTV